MSVQAATVEGSRASPLHVRMTSGFLWKVASQVVDQAGRTVMAVILARILTPDQFGVAGMAFVFTGLALIFTDLSLGAALVQRRAITERDRSTVFWTTTAGGVCVAVVSFLAAPAVGRFFSEPQVTSLFRVISLTFVLTALSSTQVALLTRDLAFRSLELREMAGGLARIVTAIVMAVMGFGVWSIVGGAVAAAAVSLVMLWRASSWRPSFTFSMDSLRDLGSYGIKAFGSRVLIQVSQNADNLLVGKYLGSSALGIYSLAYNAMLSPLIRIVGPVTQVLFPALSRIQDDTERVVTTWLRTITATAAVILPIVTGIILVAPELVDVVFGAKWAAAVPVLQVLCLGGLVGALGGLNLTILQSQNRPGTFLRLNILGTVLGLAGFVVGLHWGIIGVAWSFTIAQVIILPLSAWLSCRLVGVTLWRYFGTLRRVGEATVLMALAVVGLRVGMSGTSLGSAMRLALDVAVGGLVYCSVIAFRERALIAELRQMRTRSA